MKSSGMPFDKRIYKRGMVPNLICAILIFTYSILFLLIRPDQFPWALVVAAVITLAAEFIISPAMNFILTKQITKEIQEWELGELNDEESRTNLYLEIAEFPMRKAVQTFLFFFTCAFLLALGYRFFPKLRFNWTVVSFSFLGCVFGGYAAAILAQSYSEEICSGYAQALVKDGIDREMVAERKSFGMSLKLRFIIYLIVPLLYITIVTYMMAQQYFARYIVTDADRFSIIARNIIITIINALFYFKLCTLVIKKLCTYADDMGEQLEEIINEKNPSFYIETNLFDSLQYSNFLVNETSKGFTSLISYIKSISVGILETANNLAAISKELQATANEQNVSVSQINENVNEMSKFIRDIKIKVDSVASECVEMDVQLLTSMGAISDNMEQIRRIDESNKKIMSCVESLAKQANSIDEIMNLIEDIASQTRIIAFNAELEAVGAGKAGKNFHIVSAEIKRLADSVVESIKEIQKNTKELKDASNALSFDSQNTTALIETEVQLSSELEQHLQNIKSAAEKNVDRAGEIQHNMERQSSSFEKIAAALGQISDNTSSFTISTTEINSAASQIQAASAELDALE
ncbi:MAG: hypothetical protein K6G18_04780 [Treponema sp.]|nr:hypothetical protein [Treponema sp.]